jgi:NADPH2:quinone reductase
MPRRATIEEFGDPEKMEVADAEVGDPKAAEIRMRHNACGPNFIDVYQRKGLYSLDLQRAPGWRRRALSRLSAMV